jgi:hypothetical protein
MQRILALSLVLISISCKGTLAEEVGAVKPGDTLCYRITSEIQDVKGDAEVFNESLGQNVKVLRNVTREVEIVETVDQGLRYGFPLRVGVKWGQDPVRKDRMYGYYVESQEDVTVSAGTFRNCFKVVYATLPDTETEWYCPGTGVVKSELRHHGTLMNRIAELENITIAAAPAG